MTVFLAFGVLFPAPAEAAKEEWLESKTKHFVIFYKNAPEQFVNTLAEEAERYYDEITDNLGFTRYENWSYDRRAKIYIYDDQEDYGAAMQLYRWAHGVANTQTKTIRTFPTAHGFFDSTLPHELGHIIFRERVGFDNSIPTWMDEGVAMFQETAQRWGAHDRVQEAMEDGTFIPLSQLTHLYLSNNTPQETIDLYYAEAASIVNYLIVEKGQNRFERFCLHLNKGERFLDALDSVYRFETLDDLNRAWVNYLKKN